MKKILKDIRVIKCNRDGYVPSTRGRFMYKKDDVLEIKVIEVKK